MRLKANGDAARSFSICGFNFVRFAAVALAMLVERSSEAGLIETVEAPGITTTTASNTTLLDFNALSSGARNSYIANVSQTTAPGVSQSLTVTYSGNFSINAPGQYGGAPDNSGHDTNYFAVSSGDVTMSLSSDQAYFGLWISAADKFNQIAFYHDSTQIASLTGTGAFLSGLPSTYNGNPTADFKGQDGGEKFVFVNFYAQTSQDEFNKIVLTNTPGSGTIFESDNHTFSTVLQAPSTGGTNVQSFSAVPEPSSFALLGLGGFSIVIHALRRCRRTVKSS